MKWRVAVMETKYSQPIYNALTYATREEAQEAVDSLLLRWTAIHTAYAEPVPSPKA